MNQKKGGRILAVGITAVLAVILYFMFKDSWRDIGKQLVMADKRCLLLLFILGNIYILLDGQVFAYMIRRNKERCSVRQSVCLAYMVVFFNVTTFGLGTKPAQMMYLFRQNGTEPGKSLGILALEYVSHKLSIVLYAAAVLLVGYGRFFEIPQGSRSYLRAGFVISSVILCALVLFCITEKPAIWLERLIAHVKKESLKQKGQEAVRQMHQLYLAGRRTAGDFAGWLQLLLLNAVKITCSYVLPVIACNAVLGEENPLTPGQGIALAAVMQLLIGVIPSSGGTGSTEIVYALLFGRLLGNAACGATLILFRTAIYYVPFLVSIPIMLLCRFKKTAPLQA